MGIIPKLKQAASHLPEPVYQSLHSSALGFRARTGTFQSPEPEFPLLDRLIPENESVIDGGANFGIFALAMSPLLTPGNWVFAFEPVERTRSILDRQIERTGVNNVAVFPAALSESDGFVGLSAPDWGDGRENLYRSEISDSAPQNALGLRGDFLLELGPIGFVKLDVEGHELQALKGMEGLIGRYAPNLLVEGESEEVDVWLKQHGYQSLRLADSPNTIFVSNQREGSKDLLAELASSSKSTSSV